jgi:glutamate---cysteine ligase / carboxylate-amine ligase
LHEDDYLVYLFNRFAACRFGLAGVCVNPQTGERRTIAEDIAATLNELSKHAAALGSQEALAIVGQIACDKATDATWLRQLRRDQDSLHEVVRQQCIRWRR